MDIKTVKSMNKKSIRERALESLDTTLILFELILSAVFGALSLFLGSLYFKGVAVGLIIAWATSALAYLCKRKW
jgi:hypothetical protein